MSQAVLTTGDTSVCCWPVPTVPGKAPNVACKPHHKIQKARNKKAVPTQFDRSRKKRG